MVSIAKTAPTLLPNIVLFGEAGCGKSSIINMLAENELAESSSGTGSCTFESTGYKVKVKDVEMKLWDTTGLDEEYSESEVRVNGRYIDTAAVAAQLYRLLLQLSEGGGVNLLVFVVHGGRFKMSIKKNWKLFFECICRRDIPCVIVLTHLEKEENMRQWWLDNKKVFDENRMFPMGSACITSSRGKKEPNGSCKFDREYEESREELRELIRCKYSEYPLKISPVKWFEGTWNTILKVFGWKRNNKNLFKELKECGFSEEEIGNLKKNLRQGRSFTKQR